MINGISGSGKTFLADRLHSSMSLSVLVPNYFIRRMISDFKDNRDKSRKIMFNLMYGIVDQALESGADVIVDSKIHDNFAGDSVVDRYLHLANSKGVKTHEIILVVDKETAIERIRKRGFSEGGILNENNLEENVDDFLKKMNKFIALRKKPIIINTSNMNEKEVYKKVLDMIKTTRCR